MKKKIKVLIVEDSAVMREVLEKGLSKDPDIEVVGKAADPYIARDKIVFKKPDVITLDINLPRMNGLEFLKRLMKTFPLPVIMVSAMTEDGSKETIEALDSGAVDFVLKASAKTGVTLTDMIKTLRTKVKTAAKVDLSKWKTKVTKATSKSIEKRSEDLTKTSEEIIAIGASTGGTEALSKIITFFPENMPGTVIVQHMPPVFTRMFAERLDRLSKVYVKEAEDGDLITMGKVLVAPGDYHMEVIRATKGYVVMLNQNDMVNNHRPSVDVLFDSVAKNVGIKSVGVILTGMGKDGAKGLLNMKKSGAATLAQDEATSIVFGMPMEAYKIGAADKLVALDKMTLEIIKLV